MIVKNVLIITIYLLLLLSLIQVSFKIVEKFKKETFILVEEFSNRQSCIRLSLLSEAGGVAIYPGEKCNG